MRRPTQPEHVQTVVIGGGQAGLATGYHLAQRRLPFVILDASPRVGDVWRARWDSLRLFTPARYDSIDGMPFPAPPHSFPTKDQMANYLEAYATKFNLPVRSGVRVEKLSRRGGQYLVQTSERTYEAEHVVVAMSGYQRPQVPHFAEDLDPDILQLHSKDYRNPAQLKPGGVLLVGAGNSGAEIAMELARSGHRTWLSGRDVGHVPFNVEGLAARLFLQKLVFRFVFHRLLTIRTPLGRRVRAKIVGRGQPLIRTRPENLREAGVRRVPRVIGTHEGLPVVADQRMLEVTNIIWCTGFRPGFSWMHLPHFSGDGVPPHEAGVAISEPGLYFVGLPFMYSLSSGMIHGVSRDAERIANTVDYRVRTKQPEVAEAFAHI